MSDSSAVEVPSHVLEYLAEQSTLTLATASPAGVPHASTFLYVNDGPMLCFWTKPDTTTARHIEQNSLVSFAIDEYSKDLRQTKGVQGRAEARVILSGEEIARVAALFGDKFPDLSPGATMSISFFKIVPTDIDFIDNTEAGGGRARAHSAPSSTASARSASSTPSRCRTSSRSPRPCRRRGWRRAR